MEDFLYKLKEAADSLGNIECNADKRLEWIAYDLKNLIADTERIVADNKHIREL